MLFCAVCKLSVFHVHVSAPDKNQNCNCTVNVMNSIFSEPANVRLVSKVHMYTLIPFPATVSRLKGAQAELDKVMAQLKEKQEKLASIEAKVNIGIAYG